MSSYFKDKIPDPYYGQYKRFYDVRDSAGNPVLSDVTLNLKNAVQPGNEGTPFNAANMNYALGAEDFDSGLIVNPSKGTLLSLNGGRASLPFTSPAGVTITNSETIVFSTFYLSTPYAGASRYLVVGTPNSPTGNQYYMRVITIDWGMGSIDLGTPLTMGGWVSHRFELINPNLACMTMRDPSNTYFNIRFYNISGTTITANTSYSANIGYPGVTRPVKCGNDGCLIVSSTAPAGTDGNISVKLFRYTAGAASPTMYQSVTFGAITDISQCLNLVSYDNGNSKYLLIFLSTDGYIYPVPLTVNPDNTITVGAAVQTLNGNIVTFGHNGMAHSVSRNPNNNFLFSTPYAAGTPVIVQPAHIDVNGNVAMGNKLQLPILAGYTDFTSAAQTVDNQPTMFVDVNDAGLAIITGRSSVAEANGVPALHRLFELDTLGGGALQYLPFNNYDAGLLNRYTRCCAFPPYSALPEHYDIGSYLLVDQYMIPSPSNTPSAQYYYFQQKWNLVRPDNIIGVALEGLNYTTNTVKAQTTAKILKGLYTNLVGGTEYMAGSYGSLVPYDGVGVPVGRAVNATDFAFYGFKSLN